MKHIYVILFFLSVSAALCQVVRVNTLRLSAGKSFAEGEKTILKFPVIKTGNEDVDTRINTDLKNRITNNKFQTQKIDSALILRSEETITYMSFDVTYLKNEIISLNITMEGCGAYCSNWTEYFTYSTTMGKRISIDEIIDTSSNFKTRILGDKNKQYNEQKENLKKLFFDKNSGLGEEFYTFLLEDFNRCQSSDAINIFALHPEYLEIINVCCFPHVAKDIAPVIELKYKYADIKKYLKIKN